MTVATKICGLNAPEAVAAAAAGARWAGFVFYPRSPRAVTPERAGRLAALLPARVGRVAVVVDADDEALRAIVRGLRPDVIQLHGGEDPRRAEAIRRGFGVQVMKALSVASAEDLDAADAFVPVVDLFLFDAKPPKTEVDALPGGNGRAFDWRLMAGRRWPRPWLLSGGLDLGNVAEAVTISGAEAVDVSTGVEDRPGVKSPVKIRAFLAAVQAM
ncbi:MAG: phosphoribosylanthranilate isomerase [Alphaproteobacteria bacterium]